MRTRRFLKRGQILDRIHRMIGYRRVGTVGWQMKPRCLPTVADHGRLLRCRNMPVLYIDRMLRISRAVLDRLLRRSSSRFPYRFTFTVSYLLLMLVYGIDR
ncbi:hypothetical protein D3C84_1032570 [compost metagenome]